MRKWLSFVLVVCCARAQPPSVKALVIANSSYPQLSASAPVGSNAEIVASALREIGIRPRFEQNIGNEDLSRIIENEFLPSVQPGDVVVFYFGGRAIQIDQDVQRANYLLPSDFAPQSAGPLRDRAYAVNRAQTLLEERKPSFILFVLDAAYTDPRLENVRGFLPGLAESRDVPDSIIIYSSAKDQPLQPSGLSTVFGAKLAELIKRPGIEMLTLAGELKTSTQLATAGAQNPYVLPVYPGTFKFVLAPLPPAAVLVREPGKDELRPNRTDRQEYVWIPAGTFSMGCVPSDKRCHPEEQPRHAVTITKGFWLGRTEVEINAYQRYVELDPKNRKMPAGPLWDKKWNRTNHPITGVSWNNAKSYCEWAGGRLPTEAEWEYAARAGSSDEIYPLNDENSRDKANFAGTKKNDRFEATAPVRSFDANQFGLFDMAGNVWEWTQDWFDPNYFKESPAKDPLGPASGKEHTVRGGSHNSDPREHLRISYRQGISNSSNTVGFRCALEDTPAVRKFLF